jgi:hypothetical protein
MLLKSRFRISILILKVVKALALLVAIAGPKKVSISLEKALEALEIDLPTSKSLLPAPCKQQVHH